MSTIAVAGLLAGTSGWMQSPKGGGGKLKVYFVDVEGGQATLFVTPAGQALLIDTGWAGNDGRDADRIVAAAKDAGIKKIDYVLITHYHDDHVGGVPQLLDRMPVGAFIDHGPNREEGGAAEKNYATYEKTLAAAKAKRIRAKPGDVLPIVGMKATVVSADGKLIESALEGGGEANQYCKDTETRPADPTENARSVGVAITFGKLKVLDLGDLTWAKEMELMCPVNRLGKVDVYIVSHHGWNQSSSPALVQAIKARVAIMDNGAKKGGSPSVIETVQRALGLETLWQLHFSEESGEDDNTADEYIANLERPGDGNFIELVGSGDGSFDVENSRTGRVKHYGPSSQATSH
ncbi:ComEC/Rec2 family competence protein [Edaphobacter aggregans]|uniref:ComEC/Rec2 family competence protein n=1 Tax=Edaphobacter aggregans TaxID=570835 RepID=UPI001FE0E1DA|nr:MBL fold metallo-hydrolase [Edaphobacter aggregans]